MLGALSLLVTGAGLIAGGCAAFHHGMTGRMTYEPEKPVEPPQRWIGTGLVLVLLGAAVTTYGGYELARVVLA